MPIPIRCLFLAAVSSLFFNGSSGGEMVPLNSGRWFSDVVQEISGTWEKPIESHSVISDRDGVIWCGTGEGLYMLDGGKPRPTGKFSAQEPVIEMIQTLDDDRIWVLTNNGIGHFSSVEDETFFSEYPEPLEAAGFAQDAAGNFWVISERGVTMFSRGTLEWAAPITNSSLEAPLQIIADRKDKNKLWIADRENGLVTFSVDDASVEVLSENAKNLVSLCQSNDGVIWAGGSNGIFRWEPAVETGEWIGFSDSERFPNRCVTRLIPDAAGDSLWIGTKEGRGIYKLNCETSRLLDFGESIKIEKIRESLNIRDLKLDAFGVLWMVSENGGLVRTNTLTDSLVLYHSIPGRSASLSDGLIQRSFRIGDRIVVHTAEGISEIHHEARRVRRIVIPELGGQPVLGMERINDHGFLVFTAREIAHVRQDCEGPWKFLRSTQFEVKAEGDAANFESGADRQGGVWFGMKRNLYRYDLSDSSVELIERFPGWIGEITVMNDQVWISSRDSLYGFGIQTRIQEEETISLGDQTLIKGIFAAGSGKRLWLATSHGLFNYDLERAEAKRVVPITSAVTSICEGERFHLWLAVAGRLKLLNMKTLSFVPYAAQKELLAKGTYVRQIDRKIGGGVRNMHLGGNGSILVVPESDLVRRGTDRKPTLLISKIEVLGNEESALPMRDNSLSEPFEIGPDHYGVRIHAKISDYRSPHQNVYEYRIDNSVWKPFQNGQLELTDLEKGKHNIQIRATSSNGISTAEPVSIAVKAKPFFWRTPGFYGCVLLVCLVVVGLHFRWRVGFLKRSGERLEKVNSALAESESRYRRVFDNSIDAIVVTDQLLRVVTCNPAAKNLLGLAVDDHLELISVAPGAVEEFVQAIGFGDHHAGEMLLSAADGSIVRVLVNLVAMKGSASRWQFQMRDITKQVELEEKIRQAQKMDAVGTLAGGIAHDFNNLLAPIAVHSKLSLEALENDKEKAIPEAKDAFEICSEATAKAGKLVQSLLRFARKTDEGANIIDLAPLIDSAGQLLRGSLSSNIALKINVEGRPAWVNCSEQQFEHCLMNLVVNAGHAIGIGIGEIQIVLTRVEYETSEDSSSVEFSENAWCLEVRDDGAGMGEETKKKVFEPFFTTKAPGEGSGLGLSMVHSFVSEFGCGYEVESEPGVGSVFRLFFPESIIEGAGEAPPTAKAEEITGNIDVMPRRLLVVDDDKAVLTATSKILAKLGHEVVAENDPRVALETFLNDRRFDAVITDQMMPEITGIRLAQKIHEVVADIPVFLLTGFSQEMLEKGDHGDDISVVHMKPLEYCELNASLARLSEARCLSEDSTVALSS